MARQTSFYYSFLVLPAAQRRAIVAVWDFCRAVDDAVDEEQGGRDAVSFWRRELAACYGAGRPSTRQGRDLQPFVRAYDLPRQAFEDVIDGVEMDLDISRYDDFEALLQYCRRVASAVGVICVKIFGCRHPRSEEYALHLGVALQLTNILRDVGPDLGRGRVYLPAKDLAAFGCSVGDLEKGVMTAPLRALAEFECERARGFYQRAIDARPSEDRRRLVAAEIMRSVYFETLRRIERSGYDLFSTSTRVPRPKQALIAVRQWIWQA